MANNAYEFSRIYAQGWSAGRLCPDTDEDVASIIATQNPYQDEEKRQRWTLGFEDARRRSEKLPAATTKTTAWPRKPNSAQGEL
ncbi:hypothetical protein [Magnetospirillum sp. UT-4]|uniref:hypothetical protein n=1 Tax=Magnetospirillum sp. UT-4 TaxID=2681467 RepID=UPI00137FB09D|nr:hypothetical protein [Magnetospirillum sp. UT-4]CAA7626990.1 hypothetical protein MTBUT4_90045 [Magnetospirillum sp. UT-4]